MKRKFFLVLFIVSSLYSLTAQEEDWYKVKDLDDAFIIEFPSEPTKESSEVDTEIGILIMNSYILEPKNDKNLAYFVANTTYPQETYSNLLNDKQDDIIDSAINGGAESVEGTVNYKTSFKFNGYNGKSAKIKTNDGHYVVIKVLLADNKMYIMQVFTKIEDVDNENQKHFMDSFELINIKE